MAKRYALYDVPDGTADVILAADYDDICEHVRMCPLGYWEGTLRKTRSTTEADIIEWLAKLRELVGLDTPSGGSEHG